MLRFCFICKNSTLQSIKFSPTVNGDEDSPGWKFKSRAKRRASNLRGAFRLLKALKRGPLTFPSHWGVSLALSLMPV